VLVGMRIYHTFSCSAHASERHDSNTTQFLRAIESASIALRGVPKAIHLS
jgi:hypothetical protein